MAYENASNLALALIKASGTANVLVDTLEVYVKMARIELRAVCNMDETRRTTMSEDKQEEYELLVANVAVLRWNGGTELGFTSHSDGFDNKSISDDYPKLIRVLIQRFRKLTND